MIQPYVYFYSQEEPDSATSENAADVVIPDSVSDAATPESAMTNGSTGNTEEDEDVLLQVRFRATNSGSVS